MTTRGRKRHSPEQIVEEASGCGGDAQFRARIWPWCCRSLEVSEWTYERWRCQYGGMKSEEAKRLKELEDENGRLKQIVAEQALDIRMLKQSPRETGKPFPEACGGRASFKRSSRSPSEGRARRWISRVAVSVIGASRGATSRRW